MWPETDTARIELPPKLVPVFEGEARYRGSYGGRGSAKTRSFAKMTAVRGYQFAEAGREGLIVCGREYMNSLADSSFAEVRAAIQSEPWLDDYYDIGDRYIRTKNGRIEYAFVGLRRNLASIKSKGMILLFWADEAEEISEDAWIIAIPTIRESGSEVWATWNPGRKNSATHLRFRVDPPTGSKIVEMNWRDNPWFPNELEFERQEDKSKRPDQYEHIWEGDFVTVVQGAYYAASLTEAKQAGRIGNVSPDPLMTYRAFWDIGGTGAKADACTIIIAQFVGREIRIIDCYEAVGQPLAVHINWLRSNSYASASCILPHDGDTNDRVHDVSYRSALEQAEFDVTVIPNQGKGAAAMRIEAARRLFPSIWFNESTTEPLRDALGWYHEKKHELGHGLGPNHDWASHFADAFGLMCVAYEAPTERKKPKEQHYHGAQSWMS